MPPRLLPVPSATPRQCRASACPPPRASPFSPLASCSTIGRAGVAYQHTQSDKSSPKRKRATKAPLHDDFHRTACRHVLRGILRECTYFPDRFAAAWIRQHALARFRTYETKIWEHREDDLQKRLEIVRRKSRQGLYQLRRANEGDRKMLIKALSMAYGRIGKRRRELVYQLIPVDHHQQHSLDTSKGVEKDVSKPETVMSGAEKVDQPGTVPDKQYTKSPPHGAVKGQVKEAIDGLPRPLYALVQSQIQASPPTIARRNLRRMGLEIPELNSWHKPMPQVRIKNKLKEWYANILSTVQPPLPRQEWHRLRDLALCSTPIKLPIPRRTQLTPPPSVLEMVVMRGKLPTDVFRKDHAHNLTPRFMQRVWADVFSQCPLMEYDSQAKKWTVTWGHHVLNDRHVKYDADAVPATDQPTNPNP